LINRFFYYKVSINKKTYNLTTSNKETAMPTITSTDEPTIKKLKYALTRQVPDMMSGFTIHTNYGDIQIGSDYAEAFRNLTADILQYELNKLRIL